MLLRKWWDASALLKNLSIACYIYQQNLLRYRAFSLLTYIRILNGFLTR
ncbi:hypothetical protein CP10139811_1045 [Chlamydia ibidis]|uniref:Uncharacterized protein n=1 Tax=Chlamydia ibidis TaxID=1405396 RepID=S7J4P7_9CHLA|nr:hypothetical protein CP10139811_1045 [Chlamydia ibidis]